MFKQVGTSEDWTRVICSVCGHALGEYRFCDGFAYRTIPRAEEEDRFGSERNALAIHQVLGGDPGDPVHSFACPKCPNRPQYRESTIRRARGGKDGGYFLA